MDVRAKGAFARFRRRFVGAAAATALAAGLTLASAGTATAAMPGTINRAQCMPGTTHQIVQAVEVRRSYANEIVWVQAGLNNRITGATAVSGWTPDNGVTNNVTWPNVTSGDYAVSSD